MKIKLLTTVFFYRVSCRLSTLYHPREKYTHHPTTQRDVEKLRFAKGQLHELTAEYSFTKLKYTLEETTESRNKKKFVVGCVFF